MATHSPTRPREQVDRDIRDFLLGAEKLPSPKGSALQLMAVARDPEARLDDALRVVKSDPALAGFVLRAANSARYGAHGKALDLQRAVLRLGMDLIRVHAITLSMLGQRSRSVCAEFDYDRFWANALLCGVSAAAIARRCDGVPAEEAFSLGLLGSVGKLAFATSAPEEYGAVLRTAATGECPIEQAERSRFGFDHHELSAVLLVDWGIPASMADVVYWQRDPEAGGFRPDSRAYRLASTLQLGGEIARGALEPDRAEAGTSILYLRGAALELDAGAIAEISREALAELSEWLAMTGVRAAKPAMRD